MTFNFDHTSAVPLNIPNWRVGQPTHPLCSVRTTRCATCTCLPLFHAWHSNDDTIHKHHSSRLSAKILLLSLLSTACALQNTRRNACASRRGAASPRNPTRLERWALGHDGKLPRSILFKLPTAWDCLCYDVARNEASPYQPLLHGVCI